MQLTMYEHGHGAVVALLLNALSIMSMKNKLYITVMAFVN